LIFTGDSFVSVFSSRCTGSIASEARSDTGKFSKDNCLCINILMLDRAAILSGVFDR